MDLNFWNIDKRKHYIYFIKKKVTSESETKRQRQRERDRERETEREKEWKRINHKEKKEITIGREKDRLNFDIETDIKIIKYALKDRKVT